MARVEGITADSYGLSMSVYVSNATAGAPVLQGAPLKFADTAPYTMVKCVAGDIPQARAKHNVSSATEPLGVHVFGFSRVNSFTYTGTAPTIGDSIEANGTGGVRAAAEANGTLVMYVDTAKSIVEVLLP